MTESFTDAVVLDEPHDEDPAVIDEQALSIPERFRVHDSSSANWLVRKVLEARAYRDHVKAWAEREIARAASDEERLLYLFGRQLEGWTAAEMERLRGRRRSIGLPGGTVGFRRVADRLIVDEEATVLQWARSHCREAIVTVEKLSRSILADRLKQLGEVPEHGAHVEPAHDAFFIK